MKTLFFSIKKITSALTFTLMLIAVTAYSYGGERDLNVSYRTPEDINAFLQSHPVAHDAFSESYEFSYSDAPRLSSSYEPGSLSKSDLNSALHMLENIRYIAGLPADLKLSNDYTRMAQAASLVNYSNDSISHYPEFPSNISSKTAKSGMKACAESNLAWDSWQNTSLEHSILNVWMKDDSVSNIKALGHRRWILSPEMKRTGFGAVSGSRGTYNTMYVFDFGRKVKTNYQVAWPAQQMPVSYFPEGTPWSLSLGKVLNSEKIKVTLTRLSDNKVWNFSKKQADGDFYVNNDGYGQKGCIIFNPKNIGHCKSGDKFIVKVSGAGKEISYIVNFF